MGGALDCFVVILDRARLLKKEPADAATLEERRRRTSRSKKVAPITVHHRGDKLSFDVISWPGCYWKVVVWGDDGGHGGWWGGVGEVCRRGRKIWRKWREVNFWREEKCGHWPSIHANPMHAIQSNDDDGIVVTIGIRHQPS